jgi:amino-acid N-acetyltransferase
VDARIERARIEDVDGVLALLTEQHLPREGLRDHVPLLLVARKQGRIVGSAALEMYADSALLRSVAVADDVRGQGLGRELTDAAIALARSQHVSAVYLLTTTADQYFPRFGFERIARADVPATVQAAVEFQSACPASAIVMRKRLTDLR